MQCMRTLCRQKCLYMYANFYEERNWIAATQLGRRSKNVVHSCYVKVQDYFPSSRTRQKKASSLCFFFYDSQRFFTGQVCS